MHLTGQVCNLVGFLSRDPGSLTVYGVLYIVAT